MFFQSGLRYSSTILEADLSQNNIYYDFPFENTILENGAFVGGIGLSWVRIYIIIGSLISILL